MATAHIGLILSFPVCPAKMSTSHQRNSFYRDFGGFSWSENLKKGYGIHIFSSEFVSGWRLSSGFYSWCILKPNQYDSGWLVGTRAGVRRWQRDERRLKLIRSVFAFWKKTALEGNRPIGQNNELREKQHNQTGICRTWLCCFSLSLLQLEGYLELKCSICAIWALVTAENIIAWITTWTFDIRLNQLCRCSGLQLFHKSLRSDADVLPAVFSKALVRFPGN